MNWWRDSEIWIGEGNENKKMKVYKEKYTPLIQVLWEANKRELRSSDYRANERNDERANKQENWEVLITELTRERTEKCRLQT